MTYHNCILLKATNCLSFFRITFRLNHSKSMFQVVKLAFLKKIKKKSQCSLLAFLFRLLVTALEKEKKKFGASGFGNKVHECSCSFKIM